MTYGKSLQKSQLPHLQKKTQAAFLTCSALLLLSTGRATVAATFPSGYFYPRAYLSGPAQHTASPSTQHQFYAASSPVATSSSSKSGTTYVIRSLREGEMIKPEQTTMSGGFDAYASSPVLSAAFPNYERNFNYVRPYLSGPVMAPWQFVH